MTSAPPFSPQRPRYRWPGPWATCLLLLAAAPGLVAQRLPLVHATVREHNAFYHERVHLSFGVPFGRSELGRADELRAWRQDSGNPLPVQARALSRWKDGSVRWALVDTRLELQSRETVRVVLGLAEDVPAARAPGVASELGIEDGPPPGLRARLVDRFGHVYASVLDPASREVLEDGPLRAVLRFRGAHRKVGAEGLEIDFHSFTVVIHVLADSGLVRVEWTLENGPLNEPPGKLGFRSYELLLDVPFEVRAVDLPTGLKREEVGFELRQDGPGPGDGTARVNGQARPLPGADDLWAGLLGGADRSLYVHRLDSAHNHPTALSRSPGGPLHVGLLPATKGQLFFLDDATQKTFRLTLARGTGRAGRELMHTAAEPPHVSLDPAEVAASGAWGDTGILYVPVRAQMSGRVRMPRTPPTGWVDWGEFYAHNTHTTGSPRNRLSVFLEAVQSGRADLYRLALVRAWHAMDLRPFHIQGFRADEHPDANLYEGTPHSNEPAHKRLGRTEMSGRFPEYKAGLPARGHRYNGFDPEHMTVDDIYECYLLTGSWQAHDALVSVGEAMRTWKYLMPEGPVPTSRVIGWTLRAVVQVYRVTGDEKLLAGAAGMVARADAQRGKGAVKYLRPHGPDPRHLADRQGDDPWMVSFAVHGLSAYFAETGDPLVRPMVADLTAFMMSGYRGSGFVGCMPVDDPSYRGKPDGSLGTSQWIPGALAVAATITGDARPLDEVFGYYAFLHGHHDGPVRFGSDTWSFWQPYLVALEQRHGYRAVQDPAHFRMERAAGR